MVEIAQRAGQGTGKIAAQSLPCWQDHAQPVHLASQQGAAYYGLDG